MKKTIALASALLLTSSLIVGCGNNTAGPNAGNTANRAGTMNTTDRTPGFNVLNMRTDRGLEKQVNSVLGTKNAKVYVANNAAYVYMGNDRARDLDRTAGNRMGAGTSGTGVGSDTYGTYGNRTGTYGTGVGDRTVTDGTGTGIFSNRADNRGGMFGMRGATNNTDNSRGGALFNMDRDRVFGTNRSNTLDNGWPFNHGGTGTYTTPTGDSTGGAVTGNTTNNFAGRYSAGDFTSYGAAGNNSQRGMTFGTTLSDVQQTKVTQAIRKANPSIQNVYFIQQAR
jgi:hypothetical protein